MIPHTERDHAVFEAIFWTMSGGSASFVLVICVSILLYLKKFKSRRLLIASTVCSVGFSIPLLYAWMLVREHYVTVTDRSTELTFMMAAYLAALAISVAGPLAQHLLQPDRTGGSAGIM